MAKIHGSDVSSMIGSSPDGVSSSGYVEVKTTQISYPTKPAWATATGEDEYGLWATFEYGKVQQRLRYIKPGKFLMGSPTTELGHWDDEQQHQVTTTRGFWLFDTPVTQALWQAVMGNNPSYFVSPYRPVENVRWDDCQKFIRNLNSRVPGLNLQLPTEAQWEYAARGGQKNKGYRYSGSNDLNEVGWHLGNSDRSTHPVAIKNPNELGIYDMSGNIQEWCLDWYDAEYYEKYKKQGIAKNPQGPETGSFRVLRGGSWDLNAQFCRSADRDFTGPGYRDDSIGFRLVFVP